MRNFIKTTIPLMVSFFGALFLAVSAAAQIVKQLDAAQLGALEDNIRSEQVRLKEGPHNTQLRSVLAHHLDALGDYHERRGDNSSAARYFEAAARVMLDSEDKAGQAQGALLAKRASKNRQARLLHLKNIHRAGTVVVASDWPGSPNLDGKAALNYTAAINEKLRDTWHEAHQKGALKAARELPHYMSAVFKIDAAGRVSTAKIVASCGNKAIDDLALEAIKSLRDVPRLMPGMGKSALFRAEFSK